MPDFLTNITLEPNGKEYLEPLTTIFLYQIVQCYRGKKEDINMVIIKPRNFVFELAEDIQAVFPSTKSAFIYRNARSFCESIIKSMATKEFVDII